MKRTLPFIAALSAAAAAPSTALADQYALIDWSDSWDRVIFTNASRIKEQGNIRTVWIVTVYNGDAITSGMKMFMNFREMNCLTEQSKSISTASYRADGTVINSGTSYDAYEQIIPNSVGDSVLKFVCMDAATRAASEDHPSFKDGVSPTVIGNMLYEAAKKPQ